MNIFQPGCLDVFTEWMRYPFGGPMIYNVDTYRRVATQVPPAITVDAVTNSHGPLC